MIKTEVFTESKRKPEKFLACISSNYLSARKIIRKTSRIANFYASSWIVIYVQTPSEEFDQINVTKQRYLLNNFKLATELGAELLKVKDRDIAERIYKTAIERDITTILIGLPSQSLYKYIFRGNVMRKMLKKLSGSKIDIIIVS